MKERVAEVLGLHYKMPWPNRELETARPFRRSPLFDRLDARGAVWGSKMGWERPNVFAPKGETREIVYGWGRQNWFPWHVAEQQACRNAVALFDMTSFAKLLVQGADAESQLQRICANDIAVPVGTSVYTGMLNVRGGYESDVTVSRLSDTEFLILTGTAQAVRDLDWLRRNIGTQARCTVTDVTGAYSVLPVMGPNSRELLERVGRNKLDNASFPFGAVTTLEIGYANTLACRRTYMGELGWELYVPTEFVTSVYDTLHEAGADLGLIDAGYYAIEALRLEKGYRAWGRELTPDVTPYEAGLGFAVKLDKGCDFIGRAALIEARKQAPAMRCVSLVAIDPKAPLAHGGELLLRDGQPVGDVMSAAFGATLDRVVMLAMLKTGGGAVTEAMLTAQQFEVDIGGTRIAVRATLKAPYDPGNLRTRG